MARCCGARAANVGRGKRRGPGDEQWVKLQHLLIAAPTFTHDYGDDTAGKWVQCTMVTKDNTTARQGKVSWWFVDVAGMDERVSIKLTQLKAAPPPAYCAPPLRSVPVYLPPPMTAAAEALRPPLPLPPMSALLVRAGIEDGPPDLPDPSAPLGYHSDSDESNIGSDGSDSIASEDDGCLLPNGAILQADDSDISDVQLPGDDCARTSDDDEDDARPVRHPPRSTLPVPLDHPSGADLAPGRAAAAASSAAAPSSAAASSPRADGIGPQPAPDDIVICGNVAWKIWPAGHTPTLESSSPPARDKADFRINAEPEIKAVREDPKDPKGWRALFVRCYPGDLSQETLMFNRYQSRHRRRTHLKQVTEEEMTIFHILLAAGSVFPQKGSHKFKMEEYQGLIAPPGFEKYMPESRFSHIRRNFKWCFAPMTEWGKPSDAHSWDMVNGFLGRWSKSRAQLITSVDYVWDENMIEWCPKSTKTGGLPNLTHEKRKPTPLGTMLRSVLDHGSRVMMAMEVMEPPAAMHVKPHFVESGSSLHVSQCMRMWDMLGGDETELVPNPHSQEGRAAAARGEVPLRKKVLRGAHFRGDAFFGSVNCACTFKSQYDCDVSVLIKNNSADSPAKIMKERMKPRDIKTGTSLVGTAMHLGVPLMIVAFKFSHKRPPNILLTTAGTAAVDPLRPYHARYEWDGIVQTRPILRAKALNEYFDRRCSSLLLCALHRSPPPR